MSCLVTYIEYNIETDKFKVDSEATNKGVQEIIENVLRAHIGAGVDNSEPNIQDVYNISITWDFSDDSFVIKSNTGNKGLTDGILLDFLFRKIP